MISFQEPGPAIGAIPAKGGLLRRIKDHIEILFEQTGRVIYRNPYKTLIIAAVCIGFFVMQIPNISIDTSSEALLGEDDPSSAQYRLFQDQFGRAELIVIAVMAPKVFDAAFLTRLKSFHAALETEVPYLREVTSLINARHTHAEGDVLFVDDFLAEWPRKQIDLNVLQKRAMQNPLYQNYLISADGRTTAIVIETEVHISPSEPAEDVLSAFDSPGNGDEEQAPKPQYFTAQENREVVEAVNRVVQRYQSPDFRPALSGGPVVIDVFNRATISDIYLCIVLALIAVSFFLALLFRRISGVILPLIIIIASLASTMGLMALSQVPIKITTTVIPGFLLAVGVADSVHILSIFYRTLRQGSGKEAAVAYAFRHSGLPILMTSLTTVAGLLSFSFAELSAIAEIGVFAAAGVMLAFFFTIMLLPAMLALVPIRLMENPLDKRATSRMDRILLWVADLAIQNPIKILIMCAATFIVAIIFMLQLQFSHNIVEYFPEHWPVKQDLSFIDRHLKGTITLEVTADTGEPNGLYRPDILNRIDTFTQRISTIADRDFFVGKIFSINDIVKEINQALHANDPAYYTIPQDRETIAQELILFENSGADDLERVVDNQFQKTRITIKTPWVDAVIYTHFIERIENIFAELFQDEMDFSVTGVMALMSRAIVAAIYSMARSYAIAFLAITMMMLIFISDIKIGLLSMIPNVLPIIIIMGSMGAAGVPLTMNTLMIGSIALGLVVDDTVHFMHNFQRYYQRTQDAPFAIRETLLGTGRALLITSLVLSTGFFVLMCASLNHLVRFGFFTGMAILVALLADFLLAPALMLLIHRRD